MKWKVVTAYLIGCAVLVGCSSEPGEYPVSGKVTWNKEPLPTGNITFTPVSNAFAPASTKIENGTYSLRVREGEMKVEILADRDIGKKDPVMKLAPREMYIPKKYNSATTLKATVKSSGNEFDFPLTKD